MPRFFVYRKSDNIDRRAETRDHARGHAGYRAYDDSLSADIHRHAADRVRDSIYLVANTKCRIVKALAVAYALLGRLGYFRHSCNGQHGVLACRSFAGEHDSTRTVVYRICNVGYLRSRRAGIVYHRLEHLGRGDNALAEQAALCDKSLLYRRKLLERYLNAHIASAYHYAVAYRADIFYIIYTRAVFYLSYDAHLICAVFA